MEYCGNIFLDKIQLSEVFMIRFILLLIFLIIYFLISLPIQLAELIIEKFNMNVRNKSSLAFVNFGLKCRAVLFIGNHTSYYDIIVTYPLMQRPTGYIAKKEMKKIPFLSWWMYFVNCIFINRDNPRDGLKSVLKAVEMIENGISIFLFPEGTKTAGWLNLKTAALKSPPNQNVPLYR